MVSMPKTCFSIMFELVEQLPGREAVKIYLQAKTLFDMLCREPFKRFKSSRTVLPTRSGVPNRKVRDLSILMCSTLIDVPPIFASMRHTARTFRGIFPRSASSPTSFRWEFEDARFIALPHGQRHVPPRSSIVRNRSPLPCAPSSRPAIQPRRRRTGSRLFAWR